MNNAFIITLVKMAASSLIVYVARFVGKKILNKSKAVVGEVFMDKSTLEHLFRQRYLSRINQN